MANRCKQVRFTRSNGTRVAFKACGGKGRRARSNRGRRAAAPKTFIVDSSREGYDDCMTGYEGMETGDLIVVPSERIVAICWTWPVVVTKAHGQMHAADIDPRKWTGADAAPKLAASVAAAIALAKKRGHALAPWAK